MHFYNGINSCCTNEYCSYYYENIVISTYKFNYIFTERNLCQKNKVFNFLNFEYALLTKFLGTLDEKYKVIFTNFISIHITK